MSVLPVANVRPAWPTRHPRARPHAPTLAGRSSRRRSAASAAHAPRPSFSASPVPLPAVAMPYLYGGAYGASPYYGAYGAYGASYYGGAYSPYYSSYAYGASPYEYGYGASPYYGHGYYGSVARSALSPYYY